MPQDVRPLPSEDQRRVAMVIAAWGRAHPRGEQPLIRLADGETLSPLEMADAMQEPASSRGALLHRVFAYGTVDDEWTSGRTVDQLLQPFLHDIDEWGSSGFEPEPSPTAPLPGPEQMSAS